MFVLRRVKVGVTTPSAKAGKYITHVDIAIRQWTSGAGEDLTMCDVSSNLPIDMPVDDMPDKIKAYRISIPIMPRKHVYIETGDLSLIFVHCGDSIGCFVASTPTSFRITPPDDEPILGLCLEYLSSFYEFVRIEEKIHIVTEHEEDTQE
jgi:hypothetical protein